MGAGNGVGIGRENSLAPSIGMGRGPAEEGGGQAAGQQKEKKSDWPLAYPGQLSALPRQLSIQAPLHTTFPSESTPLWML